MAVCVERSVDQSRIHHIVSLFSFLCPCRTTLSYQQGGKETLQGRSGHGLWVCARLAGWKELQSLFLIPCSGLGYKRQGWECLEGSGRSDNSIWFCLVTCIPCSWLPIISLCGTALRALGAALALFFGVGVTLWVPRLVYGKRRNKCFSWGQDLSDLVFSLPYEVAGCLFFFWDSGHELGSRSTPFLEGGCGKGNCRGQDKTPSSKKLYIISNVDSQLSMSLHTG